MPPSSQPPFDPTDHLLPQGRTSSTGPIAGIVIIIVLLIIGALYFWGAHVNQQRQNSPAYIPAENSTTTTQY